MNEDIFQLVGSRVAGVFAVEELVAEGGFGIVYRAHHSGFDAKVALKCLKIPQHMRPDRRDRFKAQFIEEAQLLFKLSASLPNVVRPLHIDAITAPSGHFMPFLALEWLEGETLEAWTATRVAEGRNVTLTELVDLLTPAAEALERAHHFPSEGGPISIVHRDLKPENLFLADVAGKPTIKILDFGIAKARSAATQAVGKTSASGGFASFTPAFGAPEQWVPKRFGQTGPWTDVWGLALTLMEVWAGRPIFDGDQAAVMGAALDPRRRPTPRNEGLPASDAVEGVFAKALAVDPRDRYQDAGAFWRALRVATTTAHEIDSTSSSGLMTATGAAELDLGETAPSGIELASIPPAGPVRPAPAPAPRREASARHVERPAAADQTGPIHLPAVTIRPRGAVWRACVVPATAVFAGIVLAALGQYYSAYSGEVFRIGPVRLGWVTVPLVVAGSGLLLIRLIRRGSAIGQ